MAEGEFQNDPVTPEMIRAGADELSPHLQGKSDFKEDVLEAVYRRMRAARPKPRKLPDLPDMMDAGMGLTEALGFWSHMMNTPGHSVEAWWGALAEFKASRAKEARRASN